MMLMSLWATILKKKHTPLKDYIVTLSRPPSLYSDRRKLRLHCAYAWWGRDVQINTFNPDIFKIDEELSSLSIYAATLMATRAICAGRPKISSGLNVLNELHWKETEIFFIRLYCYYIFKHKAFFLFSSINNKLFL